MRIIMLVALSLVVSISNGLSQPLPSDNVTVSAEKKREIINRFVTELTAPAPLTGKLGRWDVGICPAVVGIKDDFGRFIVKRVREIAVRVGAPVSKKPNCRANVHITFTTAPQALITNIGKKQPYLLGYADSYSELVKVKLPIQAWYATQTRDLRGKTTFDSSRLAQAGQGLASVIAVREISGFRLGDGLRTVFYKITIVADPTALLTHDMGTISDHLAMLALAQTEQLKQCSSLPSILNLFTPGCQEQTTGLSATDEGYLRGIYSMDAQAFLQSQRDQMVHKIGQTLEAQ